VPDSRKDVGYRKSASGVERTPFPGEGQTVEATFGNFLEGQACRGTHSAGAQRGPGPVAPGC